MGRGQGQVRGAIRRPEPSEAVKTRLEEMLENLGAENMLLGDTDVVDGWFLETHTLGCRNAADTPEDEWWDEHLAIYDELAQDKTTYLLGSPETGIFASATSTLIVL